MMSHLIPEGFTPHDGGPCPVSRDTAVLTVRADGLIGGPVAAGAWSAGTNDWWQHEGSSEWDLRNHIIAYRIERHP